MNVYEQAFARHMTEVFEKDLSQATVYSYAMWQQRPFGERLAEAVVLPIKSQL